MRNPARIVAIVAVLLGAACSSDTSGPGSNGAPTGLASSIAGGTVHLTWTGVAGATGYKVYMAEVGGITRLNVTSLTGNMTHPEPAASFDHPAGLTATTKYYFVVTAVRSDGSESPESCEVAAKISTNETGSC